ncbi:MAG: hypothetical protein LC126_01090 [Bryobacterales bacterium]|nr:hypothetical protein [Bryobacterales bacterium]
MGRIPARRVNAVPKLLADLKDPPSKSEARIEIEKRRSRSPREVAEEFARVYGHQLTEPVYIQSVALIGRLRPGALADVERIAAPYADGTKPSLEKDRQSGLMQSWCGRRRTWGSHRQARCWNRCRCTAAKATRSSWAALFW